MGSIRNAIIRLQKVLEKDPKNRDAQKDVSSLTKILWCIESLFLWGGVLKKDGESFFLYLVTLQNVGKNVFF